MIQPPSGLAQEIIDKEFEERTNSLILSNCGLTEIPHRVFEMEWLKELVVTNGDSTVNKVQKNTLSYSEPNHLNFIPKEIVHLQGLKKLRIGNQGSSPWPIDDVDILDELEGLEELNLSGNQISQFPLLKQLTHLKNLDLSSNLIKEIGSIGEMSSLKILSLRDNKIEKLDLAFSRFPNLTSLNLTNNQISYIGNISHLKQLKELFLPGNQLKDLGFLEGLKELKRLFLNENNLEKINLTTTFPKMETLSLAWNHIKNIDSLEKFPQLTTLHIYNNQVKNLSPLSKLKDLKTLFLDSNKIQFIQPLTELHNLKSIALEDNPITDCPKDVWGSSDINQIRAFFESQSREQIAKGKKLAIKEQSRSIEQTKEIKIPDEIDASKVDDIKLIFVGNSGSGKTQLSKFFETGKLDKKRETTHGIRLNRWLPKGKASPAFTLLRGKVAANIWDFGGQEYYHGTFRLFLGNKAVYVLIWEDDTNQNNILPTEIRENEKENLQHYHFKYWLDNIRHYASTSPILIIQNKTDKDGIKRVDTKWIDVYNIFGDHNISLHEAAAGKIEKYKWRFDLFCNDLAECFAKILTKEVEPKKSLSWLKVRDAVVEVAKSGKKSVDNPFATHLKTGKYIDLQDFKNACKKIEPKFSDDELYTLPRWLHTSGTVIFFGKDETLNDKVYLDPIWVTEGIYDILNKTVRTADGVFTKKDIQPKRGFNKETVLALLMEMEIVFEKTDEPGTYIAPQYLPENHPVEDLYAIAAKGLQQKAYFVRLPLYFFRKVLQRMIFFYGMSKKVKARYYWKKGILFEKKGTRVMFKGIMPKSEDEFGVFLIGAEPVGAYNDIQKEVFHIISEILEENDLSKIASPDSEESRKQTKGNKSNLTPDIYHRSNGWTAKYEKEDKNGKKEIPVPGWLKNIEVSIDGQNFVNYLHLCQENRKGSISVNSNLNNQLHIHNFELLLDSKPKKPLKIFFSYSHKDTAIMNQLSIHLAPLKRMKKIVAWSDKAILAGDEWDTEIKENLRNSDIVLFLISADFIASSYIWEKEVPVAYQYKNNPNERVSRIIPIYLRPFDFSALRSSNTDEDSEAAKIPETEMIPKVPGTQQLKAISQWENIDEAFMEVAKSIREVILATS